MRKKATKIINYSTDILLSSLFVLIIAGTFVFTISMSPVSWEERMGDVVTSDVLGANSITNDVNLVDTTDTTSFFKVREFTNGLNDMSYKLEISNILKGRYTSELLEIINDTSEVAIVTFRLVDDSIVLSQNEYYIGFDGDKYSLLDNLTKEVKTYEIEVQPKSIVEIKLYGVVEEYLVEGDVLMVEVERE